MALSDEQISLMAFNDDPGDWNNLAFRDCWVNGYKTGARAIEAEVHKQDTELIQQMLEAMTQNASTHGLVHMMEENRQRAIAAARARLEPKP